MISVQSSGSIVSAIAVEPLTSQNSIVTMRRSPSIARPARAASSLASNSRGRNGSSSPPAASSNRVPQALQYLEPSGLAVPQARQFTYRTIAARVEERIPGTTHLRCDRWIGAPRIDASLTRCPSDLALRLVGSTEVATSRGPRPSRGPGSSGPRLESSSSSLFGPGCPDLQERSREPLARDLVYRGCGSC